MVLGSFFFTFVLSFLNQLDVLLSHNARLLCLGIKLFSHKKNFEIHGAGLLSQRRILLGLGPNSLGRKTKL